MAYIINRSNVSLPWRPRWRIRPEGLNAVRMGYANVDTPAFSWKVGEVLPWRLDPLQEPGGARGLKGLTFDGTGVFGTGLFSSGLDISQWTIWEYLAAAGIFFSAMYLVSAVGGASATRRRSELSRAKLDYKRAVADIRDKYPLLPHPRKAFGL